MERMCGIAGVMFKHGQSGLSTGQALIDMLDGCQHRGPDSTGFALYEEPSEGELKLRFLVEEDEGAAKESITGIRTTLEDHGATIVDDEHVANSYRVVVRFTGDVQKLTYDMEHAASLISIGESLDIRKDVGGAHDVDERFHVRDVRGTHGLGHVRLATESEVKPEAAHPFWATGFTDIAIVHNGQITNYWKMRRRLERRGFEFHTDNDSELIAVYLADKLANEVLLEDALRTSIDDLDGTFSLPGLDQGRDRLRQGQSRGQADDHVRERRSDRDRLGGGLAEPPLPWPRAGHQGTAARELRYMVQIDLGQVSVRDANELIRDYGAAGEDIEVLNPDARHHIGVGLIHPVRVHVRGSAGYFCAGLADEAHFEVDNNVGWGLGDNMYTGSVTVRGKCRRDRGRRDPRGRDRRARQCRLARGPGHEGGDALLRRQRQLHGGLHDVRWAHHHPGRVGRACGRGHGRRRHLCRRRSALAGL